MVNLQEGEVEGGEGAGKRKGGEGGGEGGEGAGKREGGGG